MAGVQLEVEAPGAGALHALPQRVVARAPHVAEQALEPEAAVECRAARRRGTLR
jgi:hypothetical protein